MTPEIADKLTSDEIRAMLDLEIARQHYNEPQPIPNSLTRFEFKMPALGSLRIDKRGEIDILVKIKPADMMAGEKDWEYAIRLESTQRYIAWQLEGKLPPPLTVVRNYEGQLISCNRRRWLAAIESGTEYLYCWYSPSEGSRAKWFFPELGEYWQEELTRLYVDCGWTIKQITELSSVGDIIERFKMYPECIPSEIRDRVINEINNEF